MVAEHISVLDRANSIWIELPLTDDTKNVLELNPQDAVLKPHIQQCLSSLGVKSAGHTALQNNSLTAELTDLQRKVSEFLEEYHRAAASDMRKLERFYADTVDYGQKGKTPRSIIMREKMEVAQICPERAYRVLNDSLRIRQIDTNRLDVEFDVDTLCRGAGRETRRVWQSVVSLDFSNGSPVIVAQHGSVKPNN